MDPMAQPLYTPVPNSASSSSSSSNGSNSDGGPATNAARPSGLRGDGSNTSLSESQNVRLTVAQSVAAVPSDEGSVHQSRALVYIQTLFQGPPALAALCVLPLSLAEETCKQPLFFWAFVYTVILVLSVSTTWIMYLVPEPEADSPQTRTAAANVRHFVARLRKPLENFTLMWVLIGQVWLQGSDECITSAPMLVTLCVSLVVLGFSYFLLPCIIIVLMLPFLCFCLPCVIRVLARVFGGEDAFAGKGASKDLIDSLPLKKYHAGLFTDEEDPQCSICLSSYEEDEELRILPCDGQHHFHKGCCDEWLTVSGTCPICRYNFIKGCVEDESDEEENVQDLTGENDGDLEAGRSTSQVSTLERSSAIEEGRASQRV